MATREDYHQRILDLATCRRNYDTIDAENAVRNLIEDKPSYWYLGNTTASAAIALASEALHRQSLLSAMIDYAGRSPMTPLADLLDRIVPLNQIAIDELALCYRLQSTFRDDLARRERDAIFSPYYLPALYSTAATKAAWDAEYAACQERFEARELAARNLNDVTSPKAAVALVSVLQGEVA